MSDLAQITALANMQIRLEDELAALEEQTKQLKSELRQVQEVDLPEALQTEGLTEVQLTNGRVISLKQEYYASIPEDARERAFGWLRAHGYDGIIKRSVAVEFGRGEDQTAEAFYGFVRQRLPNNAIANKESIHPSTLKAFVKERIEDGDDLPLDDFGVFRRTVAKIK